jgi:hypothetical protein
MGRLHSRTALCLTLLAVAAVCASARGQEVQPVFRAQMALAKPEVYQGRIVCQLDRLMRWGSTISRTSGGSESLRFVQGESGTSMHYKLDAKVRRVTIDAWRDTIVMERVSLGDGQVDATTRFEQRPNQKLTLFVQRGDSVRTLEADTIWHLWLSDSKLCAENLLPLCEMIGIDMPWLQFTEALETQLLRYADAPPSHDASQWRHWIKNLSDERYSVREAADRELRGAGSALLPFVRRIDPALLDAEQRFRLRRILFSMEGETAADTVASAAEWLQDDVCAWVELLDREDVADRTSAARHLARLLESEIDFDPTADPTTRGEQLLRLRDRVGGTIDRH